MCLKIIYSQIVKEAYHLTMDHSSNEFYHKFYTPKLYGSDGIYLLLRKIFIQIICQVYNFSDIFYSY